MSYRTPAEVVEVAARVLAETAPGLRPPTPVRRTGVAPYFEQVEAARLAERVAALATRACRDVAPGTAAVLAPGSLVADLAVALDAAGVQASDPRRDGLGAPLSLLPVDLANGLEFDAVVVVEPAAIVGGVTPGSACPVRRPHPSHPPADRHPHQAASGRAPGLTATLPAAFVRADRHRVPLARAEGKWAHRRCWRATVAVN